MARAAAAVLAFAVCFLLLVAPALARLTVDLPRQLPVGVDCEAAAEKLQPNKPVEAADQAIAIAVPEPEERTAIAVQGGEEGHVPEEIRPHQQRSSLLCLVFRCGGGSTHDYERQALDVWAQPAVEGTAEEEVHDGEEHESDSDWDSDCDSDDEDEGGIMGWFWRLADAF